MDVDITDLLPNSGDTFYLPEVDDAQAEAEVQERNKAITALPIFEEFMAALDEEIRIAETIIGLEAESSVDMMAQILAKQYIATYFRQRKTYLETLIATFKK